MSSANFILPGCKTALTDQIAVKDRYDLTFLAGRCLGVITTVSGVLGAVERAGAATRLFSKFCAAPPHGVTNEQLIRVVVRYIDARPQRMHEDFRALTIE